MTSTQLFGGRDQGRLQRIDPTYVLNGESKLSDRQRQEERTSRENSKSKGRPGGNNKQLVFNQGRAGPWFDGRKPDIWGGRVGDKGREVEIGCKPWQRGVLEGSELGDDMIEFAFKLALFDKPRKLTLAWTLFYLSVNPNFFQTYKRQMIIFLKHKCDSICTHAFKKNSFGLRFFYQTRILPKWFELACIYSQRGTQVATGNAQIALCVTLCSNTCWLYQ